MTDTGADAIASPLYGEKLTLSYESRQVTRALDVRIPAGRITAIVGPNACGKSTLLRALARLLAPQSGRVVLHGRDIRSYPTREVARMLGLLPQSPVAPPGICVADLVARGRFPHQTLLRQWSEQDERAVLAAMRQTQVDALAEQPVDALSGGQRQRVWLAMAIAQETPILLLDEPTTFLDIAHQYDLLELCRRLNRDGGRTLVMVLHDLNQAARYADHIIAMKAGTILATGAPAEVITPELIESVFGIRSLVVPDPVTGTPMVVPVAGGAHE
ncbi:ABC transporter ATP-binding protein [Stenotrophomonas sp. MMGLT7]|uniref:ABC transporter ATP-binding protein n=1 Tax=Stenotrophomonas sp. MMGLT7 TaxID=2901227 RepID=UPI001E31ECE8|nr:ABC transporter ATP-binding protein [Stenotrophomonas sp. MMGLT7]MCD7099194.1 ABC transporter ATP-binding protein [Stenotrophomonas sp. MMGLT7]